MRIGVTGATGALGRRIVEVFAHRDQDVIPYSGDIRSAKDLDNWAKGLDAIVHSAAVTPTREVAGFLFDAIAINVGGTANVAQAAAASGCRLVYISTSHVYKSSEAPLDEDASVDPISLYGLTKLQGEQWVQRLCSDSLILRVFSFFDARQAQSFLVPALMARIEAAEEDATLELMGGESRRDMADATWLAHVCAELVPSTATGVLNCASGRRDSVLDIARAVARALKRPDICWNVIQDRPTDYLLADTSRLHKCTSTLPLFDLDAALATAYAGSAPRPADALNHRLGMRS